MSSKGKILVTLICTTVAVAITKGYGYYKRLKYRISKIQIASVDSGVANMSLSMRIYNPTSVNVTINKIQGIVYLNNRKVGLIKSEVNQSLKGNDVSEIEVPVIVDLVGAAGNALGQLIKGNDYNNWPLKVSATITVSNVPVELDFEYKLSELI